MYAYGDVRDPLPESVRVVDEILTEFIEGMCFEASRHAQVASRQKLKFDDFEFAMRRNPEYLGKVRTMVEKRIELKAMRKTFTPDDDALIKSQVRDGVLGAVGLEEEPLDVDDDDEDLRDAVTGPATKPTKKKKKAKSAVDG